MRISTLLCILSILIAPISAYSDDNCPANNSDAASPLLSRHYYDISCLNDKNEVLINTYRHEVGLREKLDSPEITALETLLIDPASTKCDDCFDITAASRTDDTLYLLQARKSTHFYIKVYEILENQGLELVIPRTRCARNPEFNDLF
ncbi:MAG: hypothetical protein KDD38_09350 [Bdellovibrionales bacterium]|nr:hypothetical protein [Bdellovibrionales bacterium]